MCVYISLLIYCQQKKHILFKFPIMLEADIRFNSPSTIIITGSSASGKTVLTEELICRSDEIFKKKFEEVHWVHNEFAADEQMFERIKKRLTTQNVEIVYHNKYPEEQIVSNTLFNKSKLVHKAIVLDDIFTSPTPNKSLCSMFDIISHHQNGWSTTYTDLCTQKSGQLETE